MRGARDRLLDRRRAVLRAAVAMAERGLAIGSSGNVSLRLDDRFLITATGRPYESMRPSEIVETDSDGRTLSGRGAPSSEWRMHAAIYAKRPDVGAIVHTHSPYATAASAALETLPIPHDEGRIVYGEGVPVSVHRPPGTRELADAVAEALGEGRIALIARHGAVGVGATLDEALAHATKLEEIAHLALLKHQFRGIRDGQSPF
jgi:L-fuculose-phosphate aldolase